MSSIGKVNAALAAAVIFLLVSSGSAYFAFTSMVTSQGARLKRELILDDLPRG
jgi:hypothetical protein